MKKRIMSLLIAGLLMISLIPSAFADNYIRIVSKDDPKIEELLNAIDKQNFKDSGTTATKAKKMIKHALFDASFAAIGGTSFNYPNSGSYVFVIDDGTYQVNIRGAKGCFAYANYITNLVYGEEAGTNGLNECNIKGRAHHTPDSLKALLTTQAQAGEHLRIGDVHSVAFISADENGFYCLSYQNLNYSNNIELQYWTYEDFINYSYYVGNEIYLFNANAAENTKFDENYKPSEKVNPFTDITEDSPYYNAVLWIYDEGITKGVSDTRYDVKGNCTRAQAITFLWRAANCPTPKSNVNPFSDIGPEAYFRNAIAWANEKGICKGYGDGTFHPSDTVTRAQFITFLWRAKGCPEAKSNSNPFPDVSNPNYTSAILWGNESGIIKGYENGMFMPADPCNRGHVALFLYRDKA